jgi:hypothetical protein
MTTRENFAPEDPDEWDLENAETRPPVAKPRSVVSVAFPAQDFETLAKAAKAAGKKLSEFIREAALARARPQGPARVSASFGGMSGSASYFSPDISISNTAVTGQAPANTKIDEQMTRVAG